GPCPALDPDRPHTPDPHIDAGVHAGEPAQHGDRVGGFIELASPADDLERVAQGRLQQLVLRPEVVVHRRGAQSAGAGDVLGADLVDTAVGVELPGGGDDLQSIACALRHPFLRGIGYGYVSAVALPGDRWDICAIG